MKKYTLIINKGFYNQLKKKLNFLNEYVVMDDSIVKSEFRNIIYEFANFHQAKKFLKENNKVHFYAIQLTLSKKELKISNQYLQQDYLGSE